MQAFAAGLLSFLGHNPTFAVRDFSGEVCFDPAAPEAASIRVTVRADSLELVDKVSAGGPPADRGRDARRRRWKRAAYPEIAFDSTEVRRRRPIRGRLAGADRRPPDAARRRPGRIRIDARLTALQRRRAPGRRVRR